MKAYRNLEASIGLIEFAAVAGYFDVAGGDTVAVVAAAAAKVVVVDGIVVAEWTAVVADDPKHEKRKSIKLTYKSNLCEVNENSPEHTK